MADVVLYSAVVLVVVVVLLALPRTMLAGQETLGALHRQRVVNHYSHAHAPVRRIRGQPGNERQRHEPRPMKHAA
jgi:hypothetical protein